MGNAGSKGNDKSHKLPRAARTQDKPAAMREAVRKAIESLIDKKGPAKGHPCAAFIAAWAGFIATHLQVS